MLNTKTVFEVHMCKFMYRKIGLTIRFSVTIFNYNIEISAVLYCDGFLHSALSFCVNVTRTDVCFTK